MWVLVNKMTPVLKWAGGKTQLLGQIASNMPSEYNHYYEPFIGGGAVLLGIVPEQAYVNDVNEQLINLYIQLKIAVEAVLEKVKELDAECAALMIWINKHCFNGLYRVNSKGLFNVPYNNKVNGVSADPENLRAISDYLRKFDISITCSDFEQACEIVQLSNKLIA